MKSPETKIDLWGAIWEDGARVANATSLLEFSVYKLYDGHNYTFYFLAESLKVIVV